MTDFTTLLKTLQTPKNTVVLCHANPDGDAVGSALAMHAWCRDVWQYPQLTLACADPLTTAFEWLPQTNNWRTEFSAENLERVIWLDCGDRRMTQFDEAYPILLTDKIEKINIDHHPSNDHFADLNLVETQASSTCEILANFGRQAQLPLSSEVATFLSLGIYTDTGAFQHQNVTAQTYQMMHWLVKAGADIHQISRNFFHQYRPEVLHLWGQVLSSLHITTDGAAIVGIKKSDYENLGLKRSDLNGVVDYLNSLTGVQYSILLSEDEKGNVKASLRTRRPDVDVKALAEKFGGGGHVKAAGFTVKNGHLEKEVAWKIQQKPV